MKHKAILNSLLISSIAYLLLILMLIVFFNGSLAFVIFIRNYFLFILVFTPLIYLSYLFTIKVLIPIGRDYVEVFTHDKKYIWIYIVSAILVAGRILLEIFGD